MSVKIVIEKKPVLKPSHLYKGAPVQFVELSYAWEGKQYCTILMVNKAGKLQRQSIQLRHLTLLPADKSGLNTGPGTTPSK